MATGTLPQDLLNRETQDLLNPEAMRPEAHASLQDHLIDATIEASALIARHVISAVIPSVDLETLQETRPEILEEPTSHAQTRESMTAIATLTAKTEYQGTSLVTQALLALATRTQTAKHSLRTRF
jgi:hypothetical protein